MPTKRSDTQELADLLFLFARRLKTSVRERDPSIGVNASQIRALFCIQDNGSALMHELADHLLMRRASATSLIAELERKGLVKRSSDPRDKRAVRISLTPKGTYFVRHHLQSFAKSLEIMTRSLTSTERAQFIHALKKMIA